MIAYCGMNCFDCKAYIAWMDDDDGLREKTAAEWSEMFGSTFKPEDINCSGCIGSGEVHVEFCGICEIRKCGQGHNVVNCAHCGDYPCPKLMEFFPRVAPGAKDTLDEINQNL